MNLYHFWQLLTNLIISDDTKLQTVSLCFLEKIMKCDLVGCWLSSDQVFTELIVCILEGSIKLQVRGTID